MQITPENQAHEKLEQDAKDFLSELGFLTDEATYHTVMNLEVKDRLSRIYTPTSLYLRGRADRIAVHKSLPLVFEWEAKTHESRNLHDNAVGGIAIMSSSDKGSTGRRVSLRLSKSTQKS